MEYKITAEMNLKTIIAESKEVAQALNEFADNLEQIEKKYTESQESKEDTFPLYADGELVAESEQIKPTGQQN